MTTSLDRPVLVPRFREQPRIRRLVALGDSISCGEGVGLRVRAERTWVGLLAAALDAELDLLAYQGVRTREVRAAQLPAAVAEPASLATILTGLNDMVDGEFDARATRDDLSAIVTGLLAVGTPVLLARLHDPTTLMPGPKWLRHRLQDRIAAINATVDALRAPGVHVLDLAKVPALQARGGWAVDRVHPSLAGHRAMAAAAAELLAGAGFEVAHPVTPPVYLRTRYRSAELRWFVKHGAPYLAKKAAEGHLRRWVAPAS